MRILYRIYLRACELAVLSVLGYLLCQFAAGLLAHANFGHWPIENDHPANRLDVLPGVSS